LQSQNGSNSASSATLKVDFENEDQPLKILVAGSGDIRHILLTMSGSWRHTRKFHFYVLESQAPIVARQIMLLHTLTETQSEWGIDEMTHVYLEIHGNLMLREQTARYVKETAGKLFKICEDGKLVDISKLKFRERDDLESVFKYWHDPNKKFDAKLLWDFRLKRFYQRRYEYRENAIDWDFHMKLKPMEFLQWRMTGIAFDKWSAAYNSPNRTLASVDFVNM
ncbi:Dynein assembly factor 3, axonemal, partial [Nowakowskiella sp. JEL0078]